MGESLKSYLRNDITDSTTNIKKYVVIFTGLTTSNMLNIAYG